MTVWKCPKCGFKINLISDDIWNYCPDCYTKNKENNKLKLEG